MKLTLEHDKQTFTFEIDSFGLDIEDVVFAFKAALFAHGFHLDTINNYIPEEQTDDSDSEFEIWLDELDDSLVAGNKLSMAETSESNYDYVLCKEDEKGNRISGIVTSNLRDLFSKETKHV